MLRIPIIAVVFVYGLLTQGCFLWTSRGQGQELRSDVQAIEERIDTLDSELERDRRRLTEMIDHARGEMEELESTLIRATRVLARNSADFGAEMESAKDKLREVDGTLAEMRHEVAHLGQRVEESNQKLNEFALAAGLDLPVDESTIPKDEKSHVAKIEASFADGRYGEMRALAKVFLSRYPKGDKADRVQLLIAKSYLAQKRWAKALGALRRFTDLFPKSDLNPEVLYEMANAFYQLGDCTDARILVDAIAQRYKRNQFADKAHKLRERMTKNKGRCTS